MKQIKHTFLSSNKQNTINSIIWEPEGQEFKGIIQISHGMSEHILRYKELANYFCNKGFVVSGNDHLGHGESSPEHLGYMGDKNGHVKMVRDMHSLTRYLKKQYSGLPIFLLGHSMGSFLARIYSIYYGNEIDGAIYCGTIGTERLIAFPVLISNLCIKLGIGKKPAKILNDIGFKDFNRKIKPHNTVFDWLSRDENCVNNYIDDNMCSFVFTYYGYRDLYNMIKIIQRNKWYQNIPKKLPILLISGSKDPVGHYGKGVTSVYNKLVKAGIKDVSLKLFENDRHEILNELDKYDVYLFVFEWINNHYKQI